MKPSVQELLAAETLDQVLEGIRGMAIYSKIKPADLRAIWSAGLSAAHVIAPHLLGTDRLRTWDEVEAEFGPTSSTSAPASLPVEG